MNMLSTSRGTCPIECDCSEYGYDDHTSDLCYAEGNSFEKTKHYPKRELGEIVWGNLPPPPHFGLATPVVTARKIDIVRAQLMDKTKAPLNPYNLKTIGYYADQQIMGQSRISMKTVLSGLVHESY